MSKILFPPNETPLSRPNLVDIFLAGSIEMGKAEDWQTRVGNRLNDLECVGQIFNPRRDDWDSSWVQSIDNVQFNTQVNWEVDHIEAADIVYFNFEPGTMSPITLLELGYVLGGRKTYSSFEKHRQPTIVVVCPDGFWRQGNVEIMCDRSKNFSDVHFFRDQAKAEDELVRQAWSKHRALSNVYGYFPYEAPFESQRELKMYSTIQRGTKIPKNWLPE